MLVVFLLQLLSLFACELLYGSECSQMKKYVNVKKIDTKGF